MSEHADWAAQIKKHALDHYNEAGWDYVVETMDDAELSDIFNKPLTNEGKPCATYEQAFGAVAYLCKLLDERRRDVQATADDWGWGQEED